MAEQIKMSLADVIKKKKERKNKLVLSSKKTAFPKLTKPKSVKLKPTITKPVIPTKVDGEIPKLKITIENNQSIAKKSKAATLKPSEIRITTENNYFKSDSKSESRRSPPPRGGSPISKRGGRFSSGGGDSRGSSPVFRSSSPVFRGRGGGSSIRRGREGGFIRRKTDEDRYRELDGERSFSTRSYDYENNNNFHHFSNYNSGDRGGYHNDNEPRSLLRSRNPNHEDNRTRKSIMEHNRPHKPAQFYTGTRLRVYNLHYSITQENLEVIFKKAGELRSVRLQFDRTGRPNGTAYVIYERSEDALYAVKYFNHAKIDDYNIRVDLDNDERNF